MKGMMIMWEGVMGHKDMIKMKKGEEGGYTLLEMIVSLALTATLLASATVLLTQSLRLHERLRAATDALLVSEIILDKVTGEIAGAKNNGYEGSTVVIASEGSRGCPSVTLTTRGGRRVEITSDQTEEGAGLLLVFSPTKADPKETFWTLDEKLYQGYRLEELDFEPLSRKDGSRTNVIRVSVKLCNEKTGSTYARSRSVACSHFVTEEDLERILTE